MMSCVDFGSGVFDGEGFWEFGGGFWCLQGAMMCSRQGIVVLEVSLFLSFLGSFRGFSRWEVWSLQSGLEMLMGQRFQGTRCRNL